MSCNAAVSLQYYYQSTHHLVKPRQLRYQVFKLNTFSCCAPTKIAKIALRPLPQNHCSTSSSKLTCHFRIH